MKVKHITKAEFAKLAADSGFDSEYSGTERTFYVRPKTGANPDFHAFARRLANMQATMSFMVSRA